MRILAKLNISFHSASGILLYYILFYPNPALLNFFLKHSSILPTHICNVTLFYFYYLFNYSLVLARWQYYNNSTQQTSNTYTK
jgi:hypothetical protein